MAAQATSPLGVTARPAGVSEAVSGSLSFIDSAVDSRTGTITLKARFANADRQLWPGQFADVTLEVGTVQDAVLVPARGVAPWAAGGGAWAAGRGSGRRAPAGRAGGLVLAGISW